MASDYKTVTLPMISKGMVTKLDPSLLTEGQYQSLKNVITIQEGVLQSRNGSRKLTADTPGSLIHTIARCHTGTDPLKNYLYFGEGNDIYRMNSSFGEAFGSSIVIWGLAPGPETWGRRWQSISYRKASSGDPYQFFATAALMLKDPLTDNTNTALGFLISWGIPTPVFPCGPYNYINAANPVYTTNGSVATNMAGKYAYRCTLRNPRSGEEGNPSRVLYDIHVDPVVPLNIQPADKSVYVDLWPMAAAPQNDESDQAYYDPQCFGEGSIVVYRANLSGDSVYRQVGYSSATVGFTQVDPDGITLRRTGHAGSNFDTTWPVGKQMFVNGKFTTVSNVASGTLMTVSNNVGGNANASWVVATTYEDQCDDTLALQGKELEEDNDPPVTSACKNSFYGEIDSFVAGTNVLTTGDAYGYTHIKINILEGFPVGTLPTEILKVIRPGTLIEAGVIVGEYLYVHSIVDYDFTTTPKYITVSCVTTKDHTDKLTGGTPISFTAVANAPCEIACQAYNSIWLAGDVNNPNVIYRSKTGRPAAFPVANSFEVGPPSDKIEGVTEYNGHVLSLNRSAIFEIPLWNDVPQTPVRTPANRGIFGTGGWCQGDNAVWYLSYDGVYKWQGGQSQKVSEPINQIFTNEKVNGIAPISLNEDRGGSPYISDLDRIKLEFHQNSLYVSYRDTDGNDSLLVYNTLFDRWHREDPGITAIFHEQDTGNLIICKYVDPNCYAAMSNYPVDANGFTSDLWLNLASDGAAISYEIWTPFFTLGEITLQKQWGDVGFELENPSDLTGADSITIQTYYDFSTTPDATDLFTITPNSARRRETFPLQSGKAKEAYSVSFKITATAKKPHKFHSITFHVLPLAEIQRGRATDWDDLGHPYDKRLFEVTLQFDSSGNNLVATMDTISGIEGDTVTLAAQTWTIQSPAQTYPPTAGATGPVHAQITLPITDGIIVKKIRLRFDTTSTSSTTSTTTTSTASTTTTTTSTATTTTATTTLETSTGSTTSTTTGSTTTTATTTATTTTTETTTTTTSTETTTTTTS